MSLQVDSKWTAEPCSVWTGRVNGSGYGTIGTRLAHRVAYERSKGPIPKGRELHHHCRVKLCCEAEHMVPLTHAQHLRLHAEEGDHWNTRKTHCPKGHAFAEHGRVGPNGKRYCLVCKRIAAAKFVRKARVPKKRVGHRGPRSGAQGTNRANAKLTADQVRAIRSDGRPLKVWAAEAGVTFRVVWLVRTGRSYRNVV